ncbi:unnamed protein product [Adineta steineri]|uniref:Uncharacterized protein n=1 Tax=Adineta steineri TaxID=433720 RepID=A0A813QT30_9BILA|nr:unnamed protein product [Adineta steineri]
MRSLLLILLLVGSAHGLFSGTFSNALSTLTNAVSTVTGHVTNAVTGVGNVVTGLVGGVTNAGATVLGNVVDAAGNIHGQLVSTANGMQFMGNFLWDNVMGPAYDMMIEGGQLFLDEQFGNLVSSIGRRSVVPENVLSAKYTELTAIFKTKIHDLFQNLIQMEKDSLIALQNGEKTLEDNIHAFINRINDIHNQISQWAAETKYELQMHAQTVQGDWVLILNQYSQNIDFSVKTMSTMFERLAQDLMKNLVETALSVVPNALAIVENIKQQGLLSFLNH